MVASTEIDTIERETLAMLDATLGVIADRQAEVAPEMRRTQKALQRIRAIAARPAVIALAGEFNSGKSSLTNRLVELDALPTDLFANTTVPTRLHWARELTLTAVTASGQRIPLDLTELRLEEPLTRIDVGAPGQLLKTYELVDMPGLADPDAERTGNELTALRPNALIWCTPTTQAWKETERAVWVRLPKRLKQSTILALTFADLVEDRQEIARVRARLQHEAGPFLKIIAVSALPTHRAGRIALRAACSHLANDLKLDRLLKATRLGERLVAEL